MQTQGQCKTNGAEVGRPQVVGTGQAAAVGGGGAWAPGEGLGRSWGAPDAAWKTQPPVAPSSWPSTATGRRFHLGPPVSPSVHPLLPVCPSVIPCFLSVPLFIPCYLFSCPSLLLVCFFFLSILCFLSVPLFIPCHLFVPLSFLAVCPSCLINPVHLDLLVHPSRTE